MQETIAAATWSLHQKLSLKEAVEMEETRTGLFLPPSPHHQQFGHLQRTALEVTILHHSFRVAHW